VLRNVFSIGLVWADGLVRLGILWLALVGAVAASRDRRHIAIDVVSRMLPPRAQAAVSVVRNTFTAAVCALLAWYSWVFVRDSREFGDTLLDGWPAWWFQLVMPVAFALIGYRFAARIVHTLRTGEAT
jgi:TRAP-type C4-dicarboxylate transport system permease small subunit